MNPCRYLFHLWQTRDLSQNALTTLAAAAFADLPLLTDL